MGNEITFEYQERLVRIVSNQLQTYIVEQKILFALGILEKWQEI